jgi:hypothetical protein
VTHSRTRLVATLDANRLSWPPFRRLRLTRDEVDEVVQEILAHARSNSLNSARAFLKSAMTELRPDAGALVRAGRTAMRPSRADRERIAAALRARLGDAVLPLETEAAPPATLHAAWTKGWALAGALSIASAAVFFAWGKPRSAQRPGLVAHEVTTSPAISAAPPRAAGGADAAAVETVVEPEPSILSGARVPDQLAAEVTILSRATSELHAGHAVSALAALAEHERKFPNGLLSEERRAARAQALCALGRRRDAEVELRRLERSSPRSPNTARAKEACSGPE